MIFTKKFKYVAHRLPLPFLLPGQAVLSERCTFPMSPEAVSESSPTHSEMPTHTLMCQLRPHPIPGEGRHRTKPRHLGAGSPFTRFLRNRTWAWVWVYVTSFWPPQLVSLPSAQLWGSQLPKAHLLKMSSGPHPPSLDQTTQHLSKEALVNLQQGIQSPSFPPT